MKAFRKDELFKPITITLETLEEADLMYVLLGYVSGVDIRTMLKNNLGEINVDKELSRFHNSDVDVMQEMYDIFTEIHKYNEGRTQ